MIEIKSLNGLTIEELYEAFQNAFSDYEIQMNKEELQKMLIRRGFNKELSFGAFENGKLVAFTFNGIGEFKEELTAYDTGTGTTLEYRKQGLATKIFEHSIPYLLENKISQYLLEVLQHNTKAVDLYQKLGFTITREFNYYITSPDIEIKTNKNINFEIKKINIQQALKPNFEDFLHSWQNSNKSIIRGKADFIAYGAFDNQAIIAKLLFDPSTGDIAQITVSQEHRRKGIATALLQRIISDYPGKKLKFINVDSRCEPMIQFLQFHEIPISGKQFEMIKKPI